MATHILTVNAKTFPIHLEYMFIGTSTGWDKKQKSNRKHQFGAMCDILATRKGDNIIFYVMHIGFFGIFQVSSDIFYEDKNYLTDELGMELKYRALIQPKEVYSNFISEWDMMENPKFIKEESIYNMQWSWIFKKMNANRGCLTIDNKEFELFKSMLIDKNYKLDNVKNYTFKNNKIEQSNYSNQYIGRTNISPRTDFDIIQKEEDLRIYFTSSAGKNDNLCDKILNSNTNGNVTLIQNETICSFSERRIDLLIGTDKNRCLLIELKDNFVFKESIYNQLKEYSRWISAYKQQYTAIIPILIVKAPRELAKYRGCKYYKFLSNEDKEQNVTSEWYNNIIQGLQDAKTKLQQENIAKLEDLQVFIFLTDKTDKLTDFVRIL